MILHCAIALRITPLLEVTYWRGKQTLLLARQLPFSLVPTTEAESLPVLQTGMAVSVNVGGRGGPSGDVIGFLKGGVQLRQV